MPTGGLSFLAFLQKWQLQCCPLASGDAPVKVANVAAPIEMIIVEVLPTAALVAAPVAAAAGAPGASSALPHEFLEHILKLYLWGYHGLLWKVCEQDCQDERLSSSCGATGLLLLCHHCQLCELTAVQGVEDLIGRREEVAVKSAVMCTVQRGTSRSSVRRRLGWLPGQKRGTRRARSEHERDAGLLERP